MSTLTIRNLEPSIKDKLRIAAATHGRSMEEEVRTILRTVLTQSAASKEAAKPMGMMGDRIHARFAALGGVELDIPPRTGNPPRYATFED